MIGSPKILFKFNKKDMSVKIPIKKGALSVHNSKGQVMDYHISSPVTTRRKILNQVVANKKGDAIGVYRALLARRTLGKNRLNEHQLSVLTADANYIKKKYYGKSHWAKSDAYSAVKPQKSVSKKSKTKKVIIPVTKGGLSALSKTGKKVDYHISSADKTRHYILNLVVKKRGKNALSVYRALLARRTLGKNRLSETQKSILTKDADYIKKKYGLAKKKKATSYDDDDEENYTYENDDDSSSSSSSSDEEEDYEYSDSD